MNDNRSSEPNPAKKPAAAKSERGWKTWVWPASYWPTRYTRRCFVLHPWHVGAAMIRLRFWWLGKRGY